MMTKSKKPSSKRAGRIPRNRDDELVTRGMLVPFVEDIKDLIKSTAKATETRLEKSLGGRIGAVEEGLVATQAAVKSVKADVEGLRKEMNATKEEMKDTKEEMRATKEEMRATKEEMRATKEELKADMRSMEGRLTEKIDAVHVRVDNHEDRIVALKHAR